MIHFQDPNPDELLVGYIGRVARMNHVSRIQVWQGLHARSNSTGWPGTVKTWTLPLAEVLGLSVTEVLTAHTLEPFIRVHCLPVADSRSSAPDLNRLPAIQQTEMVVPGRQLRLCKSCIREDIDFWGYSYWRRSHQIPGIRWCMKHRCDLLEASDRHAKDQFPEQCGTSTPTDVTCLWSPSVQRYAEICAGLLEIEKRIPVRQARFRMRRQASALGLRLSIAGSRATVSDKVVEHFPARWLSTLMPTIRTKVIGMHFPIIDNVCRNGTNPASGATYALVLASLYSCADEALLDASRALTEEEVAEVADMASPSLAGLRGASLRRLAMQQQSNATARVRTCGTKVHQPWPFFASSSAADD